MPKAPYSIIAIVNKSTDMTAAEGVLIVQFLNTLLPTFCSDWNIPLVISIYVLDNTPVPIQLQCIIMDTSDAEGALGYHDESNDMPYGKVFVKTILSYGGTILYSPVFGVPTVAATISHEVFEILIDLHANVWWANGNTLYAVEVSDPVQNNVVKVTTNGTIIGHSDWILPTWSHPQSKTGSYNHTNTLKAPFTVDKGGYLIVMFAGKYTNVFGSEITQYTKDTIPIRRTLSLDKA